MQLYDNSFIRSLIQLIPLGIGAAIDIPLKEAINAYKIKKLRVFFNEISISKIELTEDIIKSDDFLYCYFSTVEAVLKTRRKEKIEYLARLFGAAVNFEKLKNIDEFESYLKALDDLSFREIEILKSLYDFELNNGLQPNDSVIARLKKNSAFWDRFISEAEIEIGVSKEEVNNILIMTERAGCYISSRPQANDYRIQCGTTTKTFNNLIAIINKPDQVCGGSV